MKLGLDLWVDVPNSVSILFAKHTGASATICVDRKQAPHVVRSDIGAMVVFAHLNIG